MQKYLLFDVECLDCSELAQTIEKASHNQLSARSLSDPEMQQHLSRARKEWRWEPTLLEMDGQKCHVYTGVTLRAKLFLILGPHKAWQVLQKLYHVMEQKQRTQVARRRFFAKSAILVGGVLFGLGLEKSTASADSEITKGFTYTLLSPADAHKQLDASPTFQEAVYHLGEPDWNAVYAYRDSKQKGIMVHYPSKEAILIMLDPKSGVATPSVLLGLTSQNQSNITLSWFTHKGELLATQVFQDGNSTVIPAARPLTEQPDFNVGCFIRCIVRNANLTCAQECLSCFLGGWGAFINCPLCFVCAGVRGAACAAECNF